MGKESILQKLRAFNQSSVTPFALHHFHTAVSLKGALQFCVHLNLCTASAVMMTTGNTACLVTPHGSVSEKYTASTFTVKL